MEELHDASAPRPAATAGVRRIVVWLLIAVAMKYIFSVAAQAKVSRGPRGWIGTGRTKTALLCRSERGGAAGAIEFGKEAGEDRQIAFRRNRLRVFARKQKLDRAAHGAGDIGSAARDFVICLCAHDDAVRGFGAAIAHADMKLMVADLFDFDLSWHFPDAMRGELHIINQARMVSGIARKPKADGQYRRRGTLRLKTPQNDASDGVARVRGRARPPRPVLKFPSRETRPFACVP